MSERPAVGAHWLDHPLHHEWLRGESDRLLQFHERHALAAAIGYSPLDREGRPDHAAPRDLYATARYVHSFALAYLLGRPGADIVAGHGLGALRDHFHDAENGGWFASVAPEGRPLDRTKSSYAHAFVLLASSSASAAGLDGARELLEEASDVVATRLWRPQEGAVVEATAADWTVAEPSYRGQNANMHLVEASMAAFEATGDDEHLARARSIAALVVDRHARAHSWRVPEHFDAAWQVDWEYNADRPDDQFRPYGSLVGHWFEWARLLLQLHAVLGAGADWAPGAAAALFDAGVREGWDEQTGGVVYSVSRDGDPVNRNRMHWAMAEAIGAAVYLYRATGDQAYDAWYRRFWGFVNTRVVDRAGGSWWHQLDQSNTPAFDTWPGKPDLYHAMQATLYARSDPRYGLVEAARRGLVA